MHHRSTRDIPGHPARPARDRVTEWPRWVGVLMLGVAGALATTGCAAPPRQPAGPALPPVSAVAPPRSDITAPRPFEAPDNPSPPAATSDTSAVAPAIASENGSIVTPDPIPSAPDRRPPDAVARRLAAELVAAAGDRGGATRIGLTRIRNYSRRSAGDFNAMTERLAGLLNEAARFNAEGAHPADIPTFTADVADGVSHVVGGTAYLRIAGGIELWELYLTLSPADEDFTVWEAATPIALRRAPGFKGPQLFAPQSTPEARADADDG